ncbi:hypothetical protein ACP0IR_31745, partial [Pseudomonas aeruginosa]
FPGRRLSRDRRTRPALLAVVPSMTHSAVARKARAGSMPLCCRQLSSLRALVSPTPGRTIESVACASEGQRMFAAANQTHFSLAI